ncbi:MAG: FadR/GntR family transcriptional regulator [Limnochordia bacterium]|jgi:GntR family transcriptional repressor for pyruvate dehydrogenase complex|nr:FadR family transcriptional regulator [Limnochordia bacterium]MDD2629204.1 FadR/GntR family transcriptional regulator [Limnochordia bacterium]MDD4517630.1 FadR/GntR family transcriptional regulator [Limnochordia bacterium]
MMKVSRQAPQFAPVSKTKVYEHIISQIKELIYTGKLKRGDRLPAERTLTEQLRVSRASVREAFSALEMIGLIESKPRDGTYIAANSQGMVEPLSLAFMLQENFEPAFLEFRRILEVEAARLAATRITQERLTDLTQLVEQMALADEANSIEADRRFHYRLSVASNNPILVTVLDAISDVIDLSIRTHRENLFADEQLKERLVEQHRQILVAVSQRDPDNTAVAVERHFQFVEERIQTLGWTQRE